jgi:hypothetical protein
VWAGRWLGFLLVALAPVALSPAPGAATSVAQPAAAAPRLTDAEQEAFLASADIVATAPAATGVTGTVRATLSDGRLTHDASIQTIDVSKPVFQSGKVRELGFRDTWRFNLAGYRLDRLIDLQMVPVSVERRYRGRPGSFTWWVDDVLMDEGARNAKGVKPPDERAWAEQVWDARVFDQLIYNTDRNTGNLLIDKNWRIWLIDHSRAFRLWPTLRDPSTMTYLERGLAERLRALSHDTLSKAAGRWLTSGELAGVLARRDAILELFEKRGALAWYDRSRR